VIYIVSIILSPIPSQSSVTESLNSPLLNHSLSSPIQLSLALVSCCCSTDLQSYQTSSKSLPQYQYSSYWDSIILIYILITIVLIILGDYIRILGDDNILLLSSELYYSLLSILYGAYILNV
jgi:hypothetical protein